MSKTNKEGFSINFNLDDHFLTIDDVDIKFDFPTSYRFVPEKWLFFCVTFDNADKSLKIFLDSKRIFGKAFDKLLANYEISEDFLASLQFGKAPNFAGMISDLNIWSTVLYDDKILRLYECREISEKPDVLDWNDAEFDLGPHLEIEEDGKPYLQNKDQKEMVISYPIKTTI